MKTGGKETPPLLSCYQFAPGEMVLFETHGTAASRINRALYGMHLAPEVGVVLKGRMVRYSGRRRHDLPRGGFWSTSMLEPHGLHCSAIAGTVTAVFILNPEFLTTLRIPGVDNRLWRAPFDTSPDERPILVDEYFARQAEKLVVRGASAGKKPAWRTAQIQMALLNILLHANRLGFYRSKPYAAATDYERLRPAIELIHGVR